MSNGTGADAASNTAGTVSGAPAPDKGVRGASGTNSKIAFPGALVAPGKGGIGGIATSPPPLVPGAPGVLHLSARAHGLVPGTPPSSTGTHGDEGQGLPPGVWNASPSLGAGLLAMGLSEHGAGGKPVGVLGPMLSDSGGKWSQ